MKLSYLIREMRNHGCIINPQYRWYGNNYAMRNIVKIILYTFEQNRLDLQKDMEGRIN